MGLSSSLIAKILSKEFGKDIDYEDFDVEFFNLEPYIIGIWYEGEFYGIRFVKNSEIPYFTVDKIEL